VQRAWHDVPERVATFQLRHRYRLALWELVYHDAVVAHWYWGGYSNKLPALWDNRDAFNALHRTAPMFMFDGNCGGPTGSGSWRRTASRRSSRERRRTPK
jgi:hypothetical protein